MSKLIVLSNRVSLPHPDSQQAGGLAVALEDALNGVGGIWMGWNGEQSTEKQDAFDIIHEKNVEYHTCALSEAEYQGYYCGFANGVLWPLMHEQKKYIEFKAHEYQIYQDVNLKFAQHLNKIASSEDVIWVHDYHFLSVAHYCRQLGMKNRIGFFLHIPFPERTQWKSVKPYQELAQHLAQYDLLGLQTDYDQTHCFDFLRQTLGLKVHDANTLSDQTRQIKINCYPIGVHPTALQKRAAESIDVALPFADLNNPNIQNIISVDRIDYSKGLLEKITAFDAFYKQYPDMKNQVRQLQIACPCRLDVDTYQSLYDTFKAKVNQLNQKYEASDNPVFNCSFEAIAHHELMHLYHHADICWVNSIRDGMNLVAKEYIAAQDPIDPGILILSKYAGAAEHMPEAIIVDPFNVKSMMRALNQVIHMPPSERLARYKLLFQGLKDFDIIQWRNHFIGDLNRSGQSVIYLPRNKSVRYDAINLSI